MKKYDTIITNGEQTIVVPWTADEPPKKGDTFECMWTAGEWKIIDVLEEE